MAETYWITFRIDTSGNHEARYQRVLATVREVTESLWWDESVDFLLFNSELPIDEIAARVRAALDPDTDLALLTHDVGREARAIGAIQNPVLYELMPFARHYQG